ncbi:MAG: cadherin-like beta sandwich domain-containing protein, partial [Erysipelotrichaceae bacterium]|nr:cadherin-like beta sandwich domain-containing protein [Erysipelotrichaceae bacterium]
FKLKLNPLAPDTTLSELSVNQGSLTPVFDPDVTEYTINVGNDVDSIDINGLVSNDLEAEIESGNGTFLLSEGSNTFTITVKGKDGVTTKTYTLTVIRAFKQQSVSSWGMGGEVPTGVTNTINWLLPIVGILLIAYLGYRYYRKKKDSQKSE